MTPRIARLALALALASSTATADGGGNLVRSIAARPVGGKTVVTVHGSAVPSFTAYRLERPARLVVDLADGRLGDVQGPIQVDTWAVSEIALAQRTDPQARAVRVMIGFKRPASYDVRSVGEDVVITVTPD